MSRAKDILKRVGQVDLKPDLEAFARQLYADEAYDDAQGVYEWPVALGTPEARRLYGDPKTWKLMYDYSSKQEARSRAIVEQLIRANSRILVEGYAKQMVRKLAYPYHDPGNVNGFIGYLEHALIPDLYASGTEALAEEFETLATLLKFPPPAEEPLDAADRVAWSHRMSEAQSWIAWLQSTLIPDLREGGYEATADDLDTGIWFLNALGYWCEPVEGSHDKWMERCRVSEGRAKDFVCAAYRQIITPQTAGEP